MTPPLARLLQQVVALQERIQAGQLVHVLTDGEVSLVLHALDRYRQELEPIPPLPPTPRAERNKAKARAGK